MTDTTDNSLTEHVTKAVGQLYDNSGAFPKLKDIVDAAIAAVMERLREPTEEMIEAGKAICEPYTPYADPSDVFKAMLAAAGGDK